MSEQEIDALLRNIALHHGLSSVSWGHLQELREAYEAGRYAGYEKGRENGYDVGYHNATYDNRGAE